MTPAEIAALVACVGAGLTAGLCFSFASFLMRSFDRLGPTAAIRVMQSVNVTILRSSAMAVWFAPVVAGVVAAVLAEERAVAITSTALYAVAAVLITGRGNIPLNDALDALDPDSVDAPERWRHYFRVWGRWNALRTVLMTVATAGFAFCA